MQLELDRASRRKQEHAGASRIEPVEIEVRFKFRVIWCISV